MKSPPSRVPIVDAIKVIASQLILWHHLAFYGPMSDVVYPHAKPLINWLYEDARLAVQAFLVLGGFLAARSLLPSLQAAWHDIWRINSFHLIWRRYLRLAPPYLVALLMALVVAAAARHWMDLPTVPGAPSCSQLLAHVFLLQDIVDAEALSAGVWYVAIDFQLYTLLVFLLWLVSRVAHRTGISPARLLIPLCVGLTAASLLWLNRNPELDEWAPYFFGAYGLGVLAHWGSQHPRRIQLMIALALLVGVALLLEWRSRLCVAAVTALLLALSVNRGHARIRLVFQPFAWLSRASYSIFLIHYPICLLVGVLVYRWSPDGAMLNLIGMLVAWLISLAAGAMLYRWVENRRYSIAWIRQLFLSRAASLR